jgi:hypothetical protein
VILSFESQLNSPHNETSFGPIVSDGMLPLTCEDP